MSYQEKGLRSTTLNSITVPEIRSSTSVTLRIGHARKKEIGRPTTYTHFRDPARGVY